MIYNLANTIYVEVNYLTRFGISKKYVKTACQSSKNKRNSGLTFSNWQTFSHPDHGKKILIKYTSIPETLFKKHNLPDETRLIVDPIIKQLVFNDSQRKELLISIETELKDCLLNKYYDFYPTYYKQFAGDENKSKKYAINHAIFNCISALHNSHGKVVLKPTFKIYSKLPLQSKIQNYISFTRKIKAISEHGIEKCIVNKLNGKSSNRKLTSSFHIAIIEKLYADPHKYKQPHIHKALKTACLQYNKPVPSLSWVKYYLGQTEVKNRLCEFRHGIKQYNDTVSTYTPRQKALYAGDLYQMDGTPIQFECINENGKQIRLNLYVILDAYSGKVTGFDLSLSEDKHAVINSLQKSFNLHGHLPYEILHDNFSAVKTDEFKNIKAILEQRLGVTLRAARVGNPQDKSNVERFFGTLQSKFFSLVDGYIGAGITSKRKDDRANPEFYNEFRSKGLPNIHSQKIRIIELINMYNVCEDANGNSPAKLYAQSEKPNVKVIDKADLSLLFWKEKTVKVSRSMVKITVLKTDYTFEIYDNDLKNQLNGVSVKCRYDENDLSVIHLFNLDTDLFICECKQNYKLHQALANQTDKDKLELYKQGAKKKSQRLHNHTRTNEIQTEALKELNGEELIVLSPYSIYKNEANDSEYNELSQLLAMHSNIDRSLVTEYKEINTEIKPLKPIKKPITNLLNNKLYEKNPSLEKYIPTNEKE